MEDTSNDLKSERHVSLKLLVASTMKSVLRGIEARAEAARSKCDTEEAAASEVRTETAATAHEQLAELKLLSRVDLDSTALSQRSESQRGDGDAGHPERRDTGRVEKSTFTALLGMSRALGARQQPPAPPHSIVTRPCTSTLSAPASPSTTPASTSPRGVSERLRRGNTLPTLSEESFEDAACPIEEDNGDDEAPEIDSVEHRDRATLNQQGNCEDTAAPQANDRQPENPDSDDDDDGSDSEAFVQMLSQLSGDYEQLTLSLTDLTARRLTRVRAVLLCGEAAPTAPASDGPETADETADERAESSESPWNPLRSSRSQMRHIRTVVAVDTLRMMLERHGQERACREIASAIRHVFDQYARESGVEPLHHAPAVLTSRNIARVVLLARQALAREEGPPPQLTSSQRSRAPSSTSRQHQRCHQQQQTRSPAAGSGRAPSSSAASASPRSPSKTVVESNRSLSPQRRSILASEGHHVLIHEKISSFQFRGTNTSGLALFKVRRDGAAEVEAAATRRLKSTTYSKERARKSGFK